MKNSLLLLPDVSFQVKVEESLLGYFLLLANSLRILFIQRRLQSFRDKKGKMSDDCGKWPFCIQISDITEPIIVR